MITLGIRHYTLSLELILIILLWAIYNVKKQFQERCLA